MRLEAGLQPRSINKYQDIVESEEDAMQSGKNSSADEERKEKGDERVIACDSEKD